MGYIYMEKPGEYVGKAFALKEMIEDQHPGFNVYVRPEMEPDGMRVISIAYLTNDDYAGHLLVNADQPLEAMAARVTAHANAYAGEAL
jgi:hypothetical protein